MILDNNIIIMDNFTKKYKQIIITTARNQKDESK